MRALVTTDSIFYHQKVQHPSIFYYNLLKLQIALLLRNGGQNGLKKIHNLKVTNICH